MADDKELLEADPNAPADESAVLKEIRSRWDYATNQLKDIREQATLDMRAVSGDPWDPADKAARENSGRTMVTFDELGQYVNQLINQIRMHKRAIQVTPVGSGANDESAAFLADLIRQIEYQSNAATQVYTQGFENTVQRSYGAWKVDPHYVTRPNGKGPMTAEDFNQELRIAGIFDPDTLTWDPDIQTPTGEDMRYCFESFSMDLDEFKRDWPKARIQNFDKDLLREYDSGWLSDKKIRVSAYWRVRKVTKTLLLLSNGQAVFADKAPKGVTILKERDVETPVVEQYLTNGFEILSGPIVWAGRTIPIILCLGKRLVFDDGSGPVVKILSLVRLARDPYMGYCYTRTSQFELVGMATKFPYFIRRGSLKPDQLEALTKSTHEPVAVIQVENSVEGPAGQQQPEMPVRNPFVAEIERLEVLAEASRRAIQAAMGSSPLPTAAQRRGEKSGIALQTIHAQEQQGSYHFVDAYEAAITRTGAILEEVIPVYYDTDRMITVRNQADETRTVRINSDQMAEGQKKPIKVGGSHDVTLSTGPASDSEREVANTFGDTVVQNLPAYERILGPAVSAKLLALTIRLKNIGPLGDEMADIVSPPESADGQATPEQLQQQIAKLTAQLQQIAPLADKNKSDLQRVAIQEESKMHQTQLKLAAESDEAAKDREVKLAVAEIAALSKELQDTRQMFMEERARLGSQQHETGLKAMDQLHAHSIADQGHQQALEHGAQPPPVDINAQVPTQGAV